MIKKGNEQQRRHIHLEFRLHFDISNSSYSEQPSTMTFMPLLGGSRDLYWSQVTVCVVKVHRNNEYHVPIYPSNNQINVQYGRLGFDFFCSSSMAQRECNDLIAQ